MKRFAGLGERLLQAGVAPRQVARLVSELQAHFDDLVAEARASGLSQAESESQAANRLGSEEVLAARIIAQPELRSWARQWPWLAFALLPLLLLVVQFVLSMAASVGVVSFSIRVLGMTALHPGSVRWICEAIETYALWVAPLIAAGAACLFAARLRAPVFWPLVGSLLVALVGAMTNAGFDWSPTVPRGVLSGGIGFPGKDPAMRLRLSLTLVTILAPFLWFKYLKRTANRTPPPRNT
jgi:hypothetical protein